MLSNKWIQSMTCVGVCRALCSSQVRVWSDALQRRNDRQATRCLVVTVMLTIAKPHSHTSSILTQTCIDTKRIYVCVGTSKKLHIQYERKRFMETKSFGKFNPEYCYLGKYFHWKFIEVQEICIDNRTVRSIEVSPMFKLYLLYYCIRNINIL